MAWYRFPWRDEVIRDEGVSSQKKRIYYFFATFWTSSLRRSVLRTPGGARCLHILPKAPIPALLRSRTVALSSTSAKKEKNDNAPSPEPASASSTESGSDDVPTIDVDVSIEGTPLAGNSVAASLFGGGGESKAVAEIAAQLRADAQLVVALALAVEDEAPGSEDGEDGPQLPPEVLEMLRAEGAFDEDEDDEEEEEEENDAEVRFFFGHRFSSLPLSIDHQPKALLIYIPYIHIIYIYIYL